MLGHLKRPETLSSNWICSRGIPSSPTGLKSNSATCCPTWSLFCFSLTLFFRCKVALLFFFSCAQACVLVALNQLVPGDVPAQQPECRPKRRMVDSCLYRGMVPRIMPLLAEHILLQLEDCALCFLSTVVLPLTRSIPHLSLPFFKLSNLTSQACYGLFIFCQLHLLVVFTGGWD